MDFSSFLFYSLLVNNTTDDQFNKFVIFDQFQQPWTRIRIVNGT